MGFLKRFRRGQDNGASDASPPRFVKKERKGSNTYETYAGSDAESARAFLMSKAVTQPQYYIVVETKDGTWGIDTEGLYLEKLRPWQTNVRSAKCEVAAARLSSMSSVAMAARGITDNFISSVECGTCGREWLDGVRYQNVTVVRCPGCGTKNSVDTRNINVL
jgi:DNA-directed RNA polymerase subunit RPC12/RpoP